METGCLVAGSCFFLYFPGFAIGKSGEAQSFGTRELPTPWNPLTVGKRKTRTLCTIPTNMDAADLGGFKRINVVL